VFCDSYNEQSNRVAFYVLEGSPNWGFIQAQWGLVNVYNSEGKKLKTFDQYDFDKWENRK
jgi:hypothetical protein